MKGVEQEGSSATSSLLKQVSVEILDSKICNNNPIISICAGKIGANVHDSCQVSYFCLYEINYNLLTFISKG